MALLWGSVHCFISPSSCGKWGSLSGFTDKTTLTSDSSEVIMWKWYCHCHKTTATAGLVILSTVTQKPFKQHYTVTDALSYTVQGTVEKSSSNGAN